MFFCGQGQFWSGWRAWPPAAAGSLPYSVVRVSHLLCTCSTELPCTVLTGSENAVCRQVGEGVVCISLLSTCCPWDFTNKTHVQRSKYWEFQDSESGAHGLPPVGQHRLLTPKASPLGQRCLNPPDGENLLKQMPGPATEVLNQILLK